MHRRCPIPSLDDFVDGDLPRRERRDVARHLRTCVECREEVAAIRSLRFEARRMPKTLPPRQNLWPRIQGRIGATPRRQGAVIRLQRRVVLRPAWAWAFSVGICVLFTLIGPWSEAPMQATRLVGCDRAQLGVDESMHRFDLVHAAEVKGVMSRHVAMVDDAIDQLLAALREDPTDVRLFRMLRQEYQRKMSLVRNTARLMEELDAAVPTTT